MKESKPNYMGKKFSETPCQCILLALVISVILCVLTSVTSMVSMKDLTYDEFLDIDYEKLEFIQSAYSSLNMTNATYLDDLQIDVLITAHDQEDLISVSNLNYLKTLFSNIE